MCFEVVDGIRKLREEMLSHSCILRLREDDGRLLSLLGRLGRVRCGRTVGWRRSIEFGFSVPYDCSLEDRLVLRSLFERCDLRIQRSHDNGFVTKDGEGWR